MSDDDLTIEQKLRTAYFKVLLLSFLFLVGSAIYYVTMVTVAFPPMEGILVMLWFFLFLLVVWLLADFLEFSDLRGWLGWFERRIGW